MTSINSINNSSKITTYLGNDTWYKDARSNKIDVWTISSGGSGGSGRQATSTTAGGGGGGGCGYVTSISGFASMFPASVAIVVGGESIGGVAQSSANTNGNPGDFYNYSTFGDFYVSTPNLGRGAGGTTTTALGGSPPTISYFSHIQNDTSDFSSAGGGGVGKNVDGAAPSLPVRGCLTASGGGGGGADSVTVRVGGAGNPITSYTKATILIAAGTGGNEAGTINGGDGIAATNQAYIVTTGSGGGGGGGQSAGAVAGIGGKGGFPGGGGGGGGGSLNGTNSGAGGNGAAGKVIVIEYF